MHGYQLIFARVTVLVLIACGARGEEEPFQDSAGYIAIPLSLFVLAVIISAIIVRRSSSIRKVLRVLCYPFRICWNCAAMGFTRSEGSLSEEGDPKPMRLKYYGDPMPKIGHQTYNFNKSTSRKTTEQLIGQSAYTDMQSTSLCEGAKLLEDSMKYHDDDDHTNTHGSDMCTGAQLLDGIAQYQEGNRYTSMENNGQSEISLLFPLPFPTVKIMVKLGKYAIDWFLQSDNDSEPDFEVEDEENELNSLCEIGFLSNLEGVYTFRIRSFQEECAGEYLANLANLSAEHLRRFTNILEALDYTSLIGMHRVLRTACISSRKACFWIIKRIVEIFQQESNDGVNDEDKEMIMENLVLLCLQLNIEGRYQEDFDSVLMTLFPRSCIHLSQLSMTGPLAYFMQNHKVNALQVISTHRQESKSAETNLLTIVHDNVARRYVPLKNRLDFHESMNLQTLFKSLRFTNLISLVLEGVSLRGQLGGLMRIIENGHLQLLEVLRLPFTHLDHHDLHQMGPLVRLYKLQVIDVSNNKAGSGLRVMVDAILGKPLQELDISDMDAPPEALRYVLKKLCSSTSLQRVNLKGNQIYEQIGTDLAAALTTTYTLKNISLSIRNLPSYLVVELGKVLHSLQKLQSLCIYDFLDPEECFNAMVDIIPKLPALKNLLLDTNKKIPFKMKVQIWSSFVEVLRASRRIESLTLLGIRVDHDSLLDILQFCHKNNYTYFGYSKHLITGKPFKMKKGLTTSANVPSLDMHQTDGVFSPIITICYIDSLGGEVEIVGTIGRLIVPPNAIPPNTVIKFKVTLDVKEDYPQLEDKETIAGPCVVVESFPQQKFLKPIHLVLPHYVNHQSNENFTVWYQTTEADYSSVVTVSGQWKRIYDRGITLENRAEVDVKSNQIKISMTHLSGKWVAGVKSSRVRHTILAFCTHHAKSTNKRQERTVLFWKKKNPDLFAGATDVRVYSVREDKISEVVTTEDSTGFRECSTRLIHFIEGNKNDLCIHIKELSQHHNIPYTVLKTGGSLSRCHFTIPTKLMKITLKQTPSFTTLVLECAMDSGCGATARSSSVKSDTRSKDEDVAIDIHEETPSSSDIEEISWSSKELSSSDTRISDPDTVKLKLDQTSPSWEKSHTCKVGSDVVTSKTLSISSTNLSELLPKVKEGLYGIVRSQSLPLISVTTVNSLDLIQNKPIQRDIQRISDVSSGDECDRVSTGVPEEAKSLLHKYNQKISKVSTSLAVPPVRKSRRRSSLTSIGPLYSAGGAFSSSSTNDDFVFDFQAQNTTSMNKPSIQLQLQRNLQSLTSHPSRTPQRRRREVKRQKSYDNPITVHEQNPEDEPIETDSLLAGSQESPKRSCCTSRTGWCWF
ncbi:uncharacterized protein [Amphiura filiformis]|uniref:uncharacterized protein n=1 Tax=Amphiura filiformis TaxID=82378 RepID=UPI003B2209A9